MISLLRVAVSTNLPVQQQDGSCCFCVYCYQIALTSEKIAYLHPRHRKIFHNTGTALRTHAVEHVISYPRFHGTPTSRSSLKRSMTQHTNRMYRELYPGQLCRQRNCRRPTRSSPCRAPPSPPPLLPPPPHLCPTALKAEASHHTPE